MEEIMRDKKKIAYIIIAILIISTASYLMYQELAFSKPGTPSFNEEKCYPDLNEINGGVVLEINKPKENGGRRIKHFNLYKGTDSSNLEKFREIEVHNAGESIFDTFVKLGETYYYRASALNEEGESKLSDMISITVPTAPKNINVEKHEEELKIEWDEPIYDQEKVYIHSYRVEIDQIQSQVGFFRDDIEDESMTIDRSKLKNETQYEIKIAVKYIYTFDEDVHPSLYMDFWSDEVNVEL